MASLYVPVTRSALFERLRWLERTDLHTKAIELRDRVAKYLAGVHATFSHFTSHAIDHSDQIVREISAMLFADPDDQRTASANLNATETYILLLAIYLHDAGMVVTDAEKFEALSSAQWQVFAQGNRQVEDDIRQRQEALEGATVTDPQKLFLAALEQRLLLADYFRRQHADRARIAINGALRIADDFLDGDPPAANTLGAICVGHGLNRSELTAESQYPTRRDLFGQPVNIRLLSILLRIGDLLDMRFERACPLLLSIASPLPKSSKIHWSQYQRITSRVTSPERIEIRAECESAEEHRLLRDWCHWLVEEVRDAPRLLAGSRRHAGWVPPEVTLGGSSDSIQIVRAAGAHYRAEDWRFQFDEGEVLIRLIRDIHRHEFGFLRELLQNALDATRARAYVVSGFDRPYPNLMPDDVRSTLPIIVRLGLNEDRIESIAVIDSGIGMTAEIAKNYLLQIGRSWYRSAAFFENFQFSHTSRFGVGFLSVFAVSEDVELVTRWHEDQASRAMRMRLSGARNYILLEDSERADIGTTVSVRLSESKRLEDALRYLKQCCVANEFPIVVELERAEAIESMWRLPFTDQRSDVRVNVGAESRVVTKKIQSTAEGVFGYLEFYILETSEGENWALGRDELLRVLDETSPLADLPDLDRPLIAVNGLVAQDGRGGGNPFNSQGIRWSLDLRLPDAAAELGLERSSLQKYPARIPQLLGEFGDLASALNSHLSERERDPSYLAQLVMRFEGLIPGWADSIRCFEDFSGRTSSLSSIISMPSILIPSVGVHGPSAQSLLETFFRSRSDGDLMLRLEAVESMSRARAGRIHDAMEIAEISELEVDVFVLRYVRRESRREEYGEVWTKGFGVDSEVVAMVGPLGEAIVNVGHPFLAAVAASPEDAEPIVDKLLDAILAELYSGSSKLLALTYHLAEIDPDSKLSGFAHFLGQGGYRSGLAIRIPVDVAKT